MQGENLAANKRPRTREHVWAMMLSFSNTGPRELRGTCIGGPAPRAA